MRMASGTPFEIDKRKGVRFMIKEKVIVEYVIDLDTREAALTLEDLYKSKEWKDYGNYDNRKWLFTKFKNNGKVSKTEMNNYECVNREAERIFTIPQYIRQKCRIKDGDEYVVDSFDQDTIVLKRKDTVKQKAESTYNEKE